MKHTVFKDTTSPSAKAEKKAIQELWTRVEQAFYQIEANMSRPTMAAMITGHGEVCSHRTLAGYAAGANWPHIRILKAISRATGVSLDELVFGASAKSSTVREITDLLNRMESLKTSLQQGLGLGDADVTPERLELLEAISDLKPDQIKLLLDLTRGLRVK